MGAADESSEQGGCRCPDLVTYLLGGGPVGHVVRVRDVGRDLLHWGGVGRIPPQGGPQYNMEATLEREVRRMGIPPAGGRDGGGRTTGGGDLRLLPPEYSCTVYCKQAHYGPFSSGGAEYGDKGYQAVVGTGRLDV